MKILILTEDNLLNCGASIKDRHLYKLIINCLHRDGIEVFDRKENTSYITSDIDALILSIGDLSLEDTIQLTKLRNKTC